MVTIEIRDVPNDVVDVLRRSAEAAGMSLEAYVLQESVKLARRGAKPE